MKDKAKVLTILSGVITILLGIAMCVLSFILLMAAVVSSDPLLVLVTFGMLFAVLIILFVIFLAVGITTIVIGAFEIKLGNLANSEYSRKKGSVIGYICFDSILIILAIVFAAMSQTSESWIIGSILAGIALICLIFKAIDLGIFNKKVRKGLISVEKPKVDLSNINFDALNKKDQAKELEKLNNLKEKNLITEEEYNTLRQKLLDEMIK